MGGGGRTGGTRACVVKEEPPVKAKRVVLYLLISLHSLTDHFSRQHPILQTTKFKRLFWILFVKAKHC